MSQTLVLDATTKSITLVLAAAKTSVDCDIVATWADNTGTVFTEGGTDLVSNGTTPVTVVASPAASTRRIVKTITVYNSDTGAVTATLNYVSSGGTRIISKATLAVGEKLTLEGVFDSSGNLKTVAANSILSGGTLTGNVLFGENTSLDLDPAGSVDGKYSGICITGTAGAALAFGDLIYLAVADSRWELTDADATATAGTPLIGMCVLAAAGDGSATKILLQGTIRADAKFPALTIGAPAYVGETAGAIQTAIPTGADSVIRVVGRALTADELYFCPSQDHQITVA